MGRKRKNTDQVSGPKDREKAISVAYLRLLGATQTESAEAAGCSVDSIHRWEGCEWWPEIQAEAMDRWLHGLKAKAMKGLETNLGADGNLSLKVLERMVPPLAPATQKTDLTTDGKPIPTSLEVVFVKAPQPKDEDG